jgi:hypothetical protein
LERRQKGAKGLEFSPKVFRIFNSKIENKLTWSKRGKSLTGLLRSTSKVLYVARIDTKVEIHAAQR